LTRSPAAKRSVRLSRYFGGAAGCANQFMRYYGKIDAPRQENGAYLGELAQAR
jgi:hypothetical protein